MVWAAISCTGRSVLERVQGMQTAQQYVNRMLQPHVLPMMAAPGAIFQHDNARPHTARLSTAYLAANNIAILPWPSMSPDLNPIEHIWDALDRRVRSRVNAPATPNELFQALQQEWAAIPAQVIQDLIASMPRRCRTVIAARGGHTPY